MKERANTVFHATDIVLLDRAIELLEGEDDCRTFKDWRARIKRGDLAMRDLGIQRRAYVQKKVRDAEAAVAEIDQPIPYRLPNRMCVPAEPATNWSREVMCGPLPKFPPGMSETSRRTGDYRR